jgi:hypothetical protein
LRKVFLITVYYKKDSSVKMADLRGIFTKSSKSVSTSSILVSPDSCFLLHQRFNEDAKNQEEDHDPPEPADERDIQMKYSSDYLYKPSMGAKKKKNTCKNLGQHRYHLTIQQYFIIWHLPGPVGAG